MTNKKTVKINKAQLIKMLEPEINHLAGKAIGKAMAQCITMFSAVDESFDILKEDRDRMRFEIREMIKTNASHYQRLNLIEPRLSQLMEGGIPTDKIEQIQKLQEQVKRLNIIKPSKESVKSIRFNLCHQQSELEKIKESLEATKSAVDRKKTELHRAISLNSKVPQRMDALEKNNKVFFQDVEGFRNSFNNTCLADALARKETNANIQLLKKRITDNEEQFTARCNEVDCKVYELAGEFAEKLKSRGSMRPTPAYGDIVALQKEMEKEGSGSIIIPIDPEHPDYQSVQDIMSPETSEDEKRAAIQDVMAGVIPVSPDQVRCHNISIKESEGKTTLEAHFTDGKGISLSWLGKATPPQLTQILGKMIEEITARYEAAPETTH